MSRHIADGLAISHGSPCAPPLISALFCSTLTPCCLFSSSITPPLHSSSLSTPSLFPPPHPLALIPQARADKGQVLTSTGGAGGSTHGVPDDAADDDLAAAIAASLADHHQGAGVAGTGTWGEDEDADIRAAIEASLKHAQDEERRGGAGGVGGAGGSGAGPSGGGGGGSGGDEAARGSAAEVLEEDVGAEEAGTTLQFRLPGGRRLTRRFKAGSGVSQVLAVVGEELQSEMMHDLSACRREGGDVIAHWPR